jgi:hypothetical protein
VGRAGIAADRALDQLDDALVREVAGRGEHDVGRLVVRVVIARDVVARHRPSIVARCRAPRARADDRGSARGEQVVHEIVGRVVAHPDLFEDDLTLRLDVVGRNAGLHNTSARMSTRARARVGHAHVEHGLLVRGERVHLAADRLDRLGDLARASAGRCP